MVVTKETFQKLIDEGQGFIDKQYTYDNPEFEAWKTKFIRVLINNYGENSYSVVNFRQRRFSPYSLGADISKMDYINRFSEAMKTTLLELKEYQNEIEVNTNISNESTINIDSKNIFIVHGHNNEMKQAVARVIEKLEYKPIILHEQSNGGNTVIEKFEKNSDVCFAIILLSADDIAYSKIEVESNKKTRARQNVVFEFGYFMGKLGRERVVALYQNNENIDLPSDINGLIYIPYDKEGYWQIQIAKEMKTVGLMVDMNKL